MKNSMLLLFVCLLLTISGQDAVGDGILRVPGENGDHHIIPLTSVQVDVEIVDQVAITTIRNSFTMENADTISALYHYRLPSEASVTGFGIWRDSTLAEFKLQRGQQGGPGGGVGDDNALKDYLGSNPFTVPIDTITTGRVDLELRYVELLPYDFGVVGYTYNLSSGDYGTGVIDTVSINVAINSQRVLQDLEVGNYLDYCDSDVTDDYTAEIIFYAEDISPEDDWGVSCTYDQEDIGAWLYTHRSDSTRDGYFMLVIEPGIVDEDEVIAKCFTFVIDRSGSMNGDKISQAKEAIHVCMDQLISQDYFNLISFASDVDEFSDEMIVASNNNISDARDYVDDIHATGGTNTYGALMRAVGQEMDENSANQIIFATDGLPSAGEYTDPDEILEYVTEANGNSARIFSFGIGSNADTQFLTALSEANGGEALIINPNEDALDEVVAEFYQYISRPALLNPEVKFGEDLESDSLYPRELQDVAAGKQLMLFGRYRTFNEYSVNLHGFTPDGEEIFEFGDYAFPESESSNAFVPRQWAKSVIDYWVRYLIIHPNDENAEDVIDKIVELSIEYNILTKYTEFTNPDEPDDPDDPDDPRHDVEEPRLAGFTAIPADGGVELNWAITGVASKVEFNVYRSDSPNGNFIKVNDIPLSAPHYIDMETHPGDVAYYRIEVIGDGFDWISDVLQFGETPNEFMLYSVHPNPFNQNCTIRFVTPNQGEHWITIFDLHGREVKSMNLGELMPGSYTQQLSGEGLSTGAYLLQLRSDEKRSMRRIVLLK